MNKIKILIADDHLIVRTGLKSILRLERDLTVVGEAANGVEAVEETLALKPDVVIMDLMMPKLCGAEATRQIVRQSCGQSNTPSVPHILILTTFGSSEDVRNALDAGATGAIVKDSTHDDLVSAIRKVALGERVISPEIDQALLGTTLRPCISARQQEVLELVSKGFGYPEIARILGISTDGVKSRMRGVFEALGAASRTEAVSIAIREHLIAT